MIEQIIIAAIVVIFVTWAGHFIIDEGDEIRTLPHRIKYFLRRIFRRP